jgi:inner membrane protein
MDSLSQIVLGAAVAEVCVGRKIGNKALLWGAIAGTIPDLDVITNFWMDEFTAMTLHRGFSHSIIFCVLASPIFAWIWMKLTPVFTRKTFVPKVDFKGWTLMFFWCFITHIALDCLTTWGTQIFWPLSPKVSTNSIFVADPLYTIPLLIFLIVIMFFKRDNPRRAKINRLALVISTGYLALGLLVKIPVNNAFAGAFEDQGHVVQEFKSRPMPLNIMLWTVNAKVEDGYLLGYYSIFDEDNDIKFRFIPRNDGLEVGFTEEPLYEKVMDMTQGWYSYGKDGDDLLVNDLRFGQPEGWNSEPDEFVFQYRLAMDENGIMRVHSPKPPRPEPDEAWDILKAIFKRALGNKDPSSGLASR